LTEGLRATHSYHSIHNQLIGKLINLGNCTTSTLASPLIVLSRYNHRLALHTHLRSSVSHLPLPHIMREPCPDEEEVRYLPCRSSSSSLTLANVSPFRHPLEWQGSLQGSSQMTPKDHARQHVRHLPLLQLPVGTTTADALSPVSVRSFLSLKKKNGVSPSPPSTVSLDEEVSSGSQV
jgi:hypothetical protein